MKIRGLAVALAVGLIGTVALTSWLPADDRSGVEAAAEPRVEAELRHAQRFQLDQPYTHWWRAGQPQYRSGWLLVIKADPQLLRVRQVEMPILYVGEQTAERVNLGIDSGHVVVLVPGDFELTEAPIFFGEPGLPERVDSARIERELVRAADRGVVAPAADVMLNVMDDTLTLADETELRRHAIDLVERFSPQEQDLIRGSRVRRIR